jgi:hypothetical protein
MAVGLVHRTVHVQDELGELAVAVGLVDPLPGQIDQVLEVALAGECFRLEARHLTGGRRRMVLGPAAHHGSHGRIEAEAFGVVDILVSGQAAVDRLTQQRCQGVLSVLSGARVVQADGCVAGQCEGVIEFAVGE